MRVDRLHLRNFRCFEDREIAFPSRFSVLIGSNGTGKTATLEALAVALGTWLMGIQGATGPAIRRSDVRLVGRAFHGETSYEEQFPVSVEAWGSAVGANEISWRRDLMSQNGKTRHAGARELISRAQAADSAVRQGDESVVLPVVAYYGAGRLWERMRDTKARSGGGSSAAEKRDTSRLAGYRDAIDRRTDARDFVRWMERQDRISYQRDGDSVFYRVVRQAAAGMLEEVRDVRYDKDREEVVAEFDDGRLLPFSMLSDGQRNALALAADLAVRITRLNLPLGESALVATPGVVLIDEIDLHLHPNWQRHIVEDLRRTFPQVQFIATTHSPFIIQSLGPGDLIDLEESLPPPAEEYVNQSIEDIAETVMDVPLPQRSRRYLEMMSAAERYYTLLQNDAPSEEIESAMAEMDEKGMPFGDDPAFEALLVLERRRRLV